MASSEKSAVCDVSEDSDNGEDSQADRYSQDEKLAEFRARFQPPKGAGIARKRSVSSNISKGNSSKRSYLGRWSQANNKCASFVPSVGAEQREAEFPDENLTVEAGVMFCSTCREELCTKKSSIKAHVKFAKHQKSKEEREG
eukprot:scpid96115/ scgid21268/ 